MGGGGGGAICAWSVARRSRQNIAGIIVQQISTDTKRSLLAAPVFGWLDSQRAIALPPCWCAFACVDFTDHVFVVFPVLVPPDDVMLV